MTYVRGGPMALAWVAIHFPMSAAKLPLLKQHHTASRQGSHGNTASPGHLFGILQSSIPESVGDFRPIIDLSHLNLQIRCDHFKMETSRSIWEALQQREWTFQVDIRDAYLHIPVRPAFLKYLSLW